LDLWRVYGTPPILSGTFSFENAHFPERALSRKHSFRNMMNYPLEGRQRPGSKRSSGTLSLYGRAVSLQRG
jgi:hypothetical protein